ncbi:MAG: 4-hydroxy-tetrahydrodipicolinate reductase [Flavobacteriales bacterium]|nr:4-hydroxy-tetrahydrodipicolinate reductase [Flavobacteriales bacterium]MCB9198586.1 4-hydroxy-tetrahydrodipicolinate reductase [Flavobacteriales bacterium]
MNIALIGYGKMGKIIEDIAISRGHNIGLKVTSENSDFSSEDLKDIDVAIEFSIPEAAVENIKKCLNAGVPIAVGTTGWYESIDDIAQLTKEKNGCILPATNFSIGVNIFFEINKHLAALMAKQKQYEAMITEIHHTQKKDAPSGTAITLAEGIIEKSETKDRWTKELADLKSDLAIKSLRVEDVPGTHEVEYDSDIDVITISHVAKNRKGFGLGAVLAAEFITGKTGIYSMKDVLAI